MNLLRSITRRGFSVGTAGWFTVLRPNTWFPASRLSTGFRSPVIRASSVPDHTSHLQATPAPAFLVSAPAQRPLRTASIVLAAISITAALLWWIMHP